MAVLDNQDPVAKQRGLIAALFVAMRPKQWSKNLLVFAGWLFTIDEKHNPHDILTVFTGFILFCILSSVVYLINDIADRESDRKHPKKRFRPIASGELTVNHAVTFAVLLTIVGLTCSFWLEPRFGLTALIYFLLTLGYTFRFKHVVIVDVLTLAAGFVLRAIAGTLLLYVAISHWLILCTLMLALFLGLSKRRAELISTQQSGVNGTRPILDEYSAPMLDQMIVIVTSACLMSYSLYTVESNAASKHHYLMITIPFVIYGIFRYLYLMHRHELGESPDAVLIEDRPMLINIVLWGITTGLIVSHAFQAWIQHIF